MPFIAFLSCLLCENAQVLGLDWKGEKKQPMSKEKLKDFRKKMVIKSGSWKQNIKRWEVTQDFCTVLYMKLTFNGSNSCLWAHHADVTLFQGTKNWKPLIAAALWSPITNYMEVTHSILCAFIIPFTDISWHSQTHTKRTQFITSLLMGPGMIW